MARSRAYVKTKYSLRKAKKFAKKHPIAAALFAAAIVLIIVLGSLGGNDSEAPASSEPRDGFYVHYIDVGQGDCELVECDGEYMLIDAGWPESGNAVVKYLRKQGITRIEYLVCSHGDADHCGGLDAVVEGFEIGTVFVSPYSENKPACEIFLEAAEKAGLEAETPDMGISYALGSAAVKFLGPTVNNGDNNEDSLVLRVEYGSTSFLFTGDIQRLGEQALFDSGAELNCDVLKVAHHGSDSSTSYRFLYETMPQLAVISCGENNSYGHPHEAVLSRLSDADVTVYRTDKEGTVVIFSDGEKVERVKS
ncbi:MAG: ComEC/Rec2 family competence protein [Bacillota bacterium]|nr:ComEC/Rec2 family competence protein [Bacillota bacterium]